MIEKLFRRGGSGDASFFEDEAGEEPSQKDWISETLDQIKGFGASKLEEIVERFNAALPFVERAGFHVTEIEVELGVNPKVIPHMVLDRHIPDDERALLMEEIAGRKMVSVIVSSLFKAADFGERIDFTGHRFFEIEIEVGIIPAVKIKFEPAKD